MVAALCNLNMSPDATQESGSNTQESGSNGANVEVYMKYLETLFNQTTPTSYQYFNNIELLRCSVNIALLATPTGDVKDKDGRPL